MSPPHDTHHHHHAALLAFGTASLMAVTAATAQVAGGQIDNSGDYRQEVKACQEGRTGQDRATCLREARQARAEKLRGRLDNAGSLQANALARCNVFKADEDRLACRERVAGSGENYGSVAGGGILREFSYEVPSPQQSEMGAGSPPGPGATPAPESEPGATMPDMDDAEGDDTEEAQPPMEQQ
jgi:hypothetical protein